MYISISIPCEIQPKPLLWNAFGNEYVYMIYIYIYMNMNKQIVYTFMSIPCKSQTKPHLWNTFSNEQRQPLACCAYQDHLFV